MKLLTKRQASVESQSRRKAEIDEGLKLEGIVSALRETKEKEEKGLQQFREGSLSDIQREINEEIGKRDALKRENARLTEERVRLSAPPDLTKLWEEAKALHKDGEEWSSRLAEHEIELLAREGDAEKRHKDLNKRQEVIEANEQTLAQSLEDASSMKTDAKIELAEARNLAQRLTSEAELRVQEVAIRELEAKQMKEEAERQKEKNLADEIKNAQDSKALQVRYQTLLRAERYAKQKYDINTKGNGN